MSRVKSRTREADHPVAVDVGVTGFLLLIEWGNCPSNGKSGGGLGKKQKACDADVDGDRVVGLYDLLLVLDNMNSDCGGKRRYVPLIP